MSCGQRLSNEYVTSLFSEYLLLQHKSDICKILVNSKDPHQSVVVHFNFLCEFNSIFSELILSKPEETLPLLNDTLRDVILNDSKNSEFKAQHVHVRLTALPMIPEVYKNNIPRSHDIGKFIALRAVVSRVGPVQILEGAARYFCSKCGFYFYVHATAETNYVLKSPRFCPNRKKNCNSTMIKHITEERFLAKNYQEIRVHEQFGSLLGVMRRSISVCIEDDLLETVKPGDDVVINGVVSCKWRLMKEGLPCRIVTFLKANYIENLSEIKFGNGQSRLTNERIVEFENLRAKSVDFYCALDIRNQVLRSICPNVYGMYLIKLSLALMLAGAPEWTSSQDNQESNQLCLRIRGSPHILLIGDPGTAKSVLLRGCTSLCDRAVLTTATGTTAAGLTATAVRDSSGWTLDAGALVLSDGGLCAIDEFTALHGAHRAAVHEAMEQQTISLAKAGLVARLNCRCSVLAAANPPFNFKNDSYKEDFGLSSPLLSRFDLIWRLVDPLDSAEWDRKISDFVLKLDDSCGKSGFSNQIWPMDRLKEYFQWIRDRFRPQLSMAAANLLQRYYVWQRKRLFEFDLEGYASGRRTLRLMESLVRLTKAHARLMARSEAVIQDAVIVIYLVDASFSSASFGGCAQPSICAKSLTPESIVSMTIPRNARFDYDEIEKLVFTALNQIGCLVEAENLKVDEQTQSIVTHNDLMMNGGDNNNNNNDDKCKSYLIEPLLSSTQILLRSDDIKKSNVRNDFSSKNRLIPSKRLRFDDTMVNELSKGFDKRPLFTKQLNAKLAKFEHVSIENNVKLDMCNLSTHRVTSQVETKVSNGLISFGFQRELTDEDFEIDL